MTLFVWCTFWEGIQFFYSRDNRKDPVCMRLRWIHGTLILSQSLALQFDGYRINKSDYDGVGRIGVILRLSDFYNSLNFLFQLAMATGHPVSGLLGEKFTCLICGQEDLLEEDMRSHVLLEHVECNICCPFCDLSGITNEEMNTHINSVHFDDLMSPIEICNGETRERVGREDIDKFGLQNGGAIPKTNIGTQGGLKHSQSLDKGKGAVSPKKSSSMKSSQSESNLDRSKLQLTFPAVLNPHPSSSVRQSRSSTAIKSSTSSHSIRSSASSLIRPSTSFDVFQPETARLDDHDRSYEMNGINSPAISASMSSISGIHASMNNSIQEEELMDDDNNNEPTQPNNNTPLIPDINDNIQMDVNSNIPAEFSCPLCQFITSSENLIQTHVNMVHVDILSPAKALSSTDSLGRGTSAQNSSSDNTISELTANGTDSLEDEYPCPICQRTFSNSGELSLHVNTQHSNIFSPDKPGPNQASCSNEDWLMRDELLCPVCEQIFYDRNKLQVHVNGHFSAEQTPGEWLYKFTNFFFRQGNTWIMNSWKIIGAK